MVGWTDFQNRTYTRSSQGREEDDKDETGDVSTSQLRAGPAVRHEAGLHGAWILYGL